MTNSVVAFGALAVASVAYAIVLNTDRGKKFVMGYTWASVVIGTGLVLAALWFIIPQEAWQKAALGFVVAGIPMIMRSLINKARRA